MTRHLKMAKSYLNDKIYPLTDLVNLLQFLITAQLASHQIWTVHQFLGYASHGGAGSSYRNFVIFLPSNM
jgi:hypothetical protein